MAEPAKILVVDDDPDIVESSRLVLESANYQVLTAGSPEEAWEQVTANKPDLILLDIMMPDRTEGFQFVWKLRSQGPEDVRDVPIIVISAIHETTDLRFYPDQSDGTYKPGEFLPVQGFIDKPLEPKALLAKIAELVGK
jgi:CheY-like chemotaxis protein